MARETPKQQAQHDRAYYIWRLRGLYTQVSMVQDTARREAAHAIVEAELVSLGAETCADRRARLDKLHQQWLDGDEEAGNLYKKETRNKFPTRRFTF